MLYGEIMEVKGTLYEKSLMSLKRILDTGYHLLGNPVRVYDNDYRLVASSENTADDDPIWNEVKLIGKLSDATVRLLLTERVADVLAKASIATIPGGDKLKFERIIAKIHDASGGQAGYVSAVACNRHFMPQDVGLVKQICERIMRKTEVNVLFYNDDKIRCEKAFVRLIEGEEASEQNIMERLYSGLKKNIHIAVVDMAYTEQNLTHHGFYRDLFAHLNPAHKYFMYSGNIVVLVSTDAPVFSINNDMGELNDFFCEHDIYAGVSSGFENLKETNRYYRQAINALNYGSICNRYQHIFVYDEYKLYRNMKRLRSAREIRDDFVNPVIFDIIKYDADNQTSYYEFLREYLTLGGDACLASLKLNISARAMIERLSEIEEIFHIDRSNGNTMLSLHLSINMRELFLMEK